jgi:hypothetical protein
MAYSWSLDIPGGTAQSDVPVTVTVTNQADPVSGSGFSPLIGGVTLQGASTMRYERRTTPSASGEIPAPPPLSCNCTAWIPQGCGQGSCGSGQERQTRACSPSGCGQTAQCQSSAACL